MALKLSTLSELRAAKGEGVMSKHTHTPGPWVAKKRSQGKTKVAAMRVWAPDWIKVASITDLGDQTAPNARLIAAAPAMLEALKEGRRPIHALAIGALPDDPLVALLRKIDAAIRAATGEQTPVDPRSPDPTREGVFRDHNCSVCDDGKRPCVKGNPRDCDTLFARND